MRTQQVWKTVDGKTFEDIESASRHEEALFVDWLHTSPNIPVNGFLHSFDSKILLDCGGTEKDRARQMLKDYFLNIHS